MMKGWIVVAAALPMLAAVATIRPSEGPETRAYRVGLLAWRKRGRIDNAACANCHGPDGLELASYRFDDATLRRRGRPHLPVADVERLVSFIHAVRHRYGINVLRDPLRDRPFQPGGTVLPGATPAERDEAFGIELGRKLPRLFGARILTLADARQAAKEVMAVNPWTLRVGIPFNRFSEDSFHGSEHASLAHWLPDVARLIPPKNLGPWYQLQDEYLAQPTDANLWRTFDGFDRLTSPLATTDISLMAAQKYRSLLILQHLQRQNLRRSPTAQTVEMFADYKDSLIPNPMWQTGEYARIAQDLNPESFGLDPKLIAKKSGGPTFVRQLQDVQTSWFYLGWLFDQGLERTSREIVAARGDWLALALGNAGPYPIHNIFWLARKQLVVNEIPSAWGGVPRRRHPEFEYMAIRVGGRYISDIPSEPRYRARYIRLTANAFRMSLRLMLDHWEKTHQVWFRNAVRSHIRALTDFINTYDPASPTEASDLRDKIETVLGHCEDLN